MGKYTVGDLIEYRRKFVRTWAIAMRDGHDRWWVAEELGSTPGKVNNMYLRLRNAGVKLDPLVRHDHRVETTADEMNAIIAEELAQ